VTAVTRAPTSCSPPEGWSWPLSAANAKKALSAKSARWCWVVALDHQGAQIRSAGTVPGKVYTVEPTGDVTFAQVFVSGAVVNVSVARVSARPTSGVHRVRSDRLHLFDGETGWRSTRILPPDRLFSIGAG